MIRKRGLTIDDLPIDAPTPGSVQAGLNWLTKVQESRWGDAVIRCDQDIFAVRCKPHGVIVGRVARYSLIYAEKPVVETLGWEGLLAIPTAGETHEMVKGHQQSRRDVNRRVDALLAQAAQDNRPAPLVRWPKADRGMGPPFEGVQPRHRTRSEALVRWATGTVYTALLNDRSLPEELPAACPRCGGLSVRRGWLLSLASMESPAAVYRLPSP